MKSAWDFVITCRNACSHPIIIFSARGYGYKEYGCWVTKLASFKVVDKMFASSITQICLKWMVVTFKDMVCSFFFFFCEDLWDHVIAISILCCYSLSIFILFKEKITFLQFVNMSPWLILLFPGHWWLIACSVSPLVVKISWIGFVHLALIIITFFFYFVNMVSAFMRKSNQYVHLNFMHSKQVNKLLF